MEGGFARMYSCHLKRLSRVIFMKETVTARRKYVSYRTSRVKRLRQGQYGIHNVNPQSDRWSDGTLLKQKRLNDTVSWSCVCSARAAVCSALILHVLLDVPVQVLCFLQVILSSHNLEWLRTICWKRRVDVSYCVRKRYLRVETGEQWTLL